MKYIVMTAIKQFALFLLVSTLLSACGGGGGGGGTEAVEEGGDNLTPSSTSLNSQTVTFLQAGPLNLSVGDTMSNPASGPGTGAITYTSSDPSVATVNSGGMVTAVGAGTTEIRADKAEDADYSTANASYSLNSSVANSQSAQTITFLQAGPLSLFIGDAVSNPASGPGTGAITYTSSNPSVATVDSDGLVTVVGAGDTEIQADKAADADYLAASASYILDSVAANITANTSASIWIGANDTEVNFPASEAGKFLYRSSDTNCDLNNYATCDDGQLDIIGASPITDTAATLNQTAYYTLDDGNQKVKRTISTGQSYTERSALQTVSFDNKLWVIGGNTKDGYTNDVWTSRNGVTWTEQTNPTNPASFPVRAQHQVVVFDNKLWVIGGFVIDHLTETVTLTSYNDVWSSSDGINWEEQTSKSSQPHFSARSEFQVVVFMNKLWVIGGATSTELKNDVWSSVDGIDWVQETDEADFPPVREHQVVVYDNQLWLIGGRAGRYPSNEIWSSNDGVHWDPQTSQTLPARAGHQVAVYNNQLWLIGGYGDDKKIHNDVWFSTDGLNWEQKTEQAQFPVRTHHSALAFDNKLFVIGGWGQGGNHYNDVWRSRDGRNWRFGLSTTIFNAP